MVSQVKHSLFSLLFLLQIVILKCFKPCHKHGLLNVIVWVSVAAGTYYFQLIKQLLKLGLFLDTGLESWESLETVESVKSTSVQCDHMAENIRSQLFVDIDLH